MIAELAEQARDNDWDESGSIKYYLRLAEQYRHDGKGFLEQSDLESAFVAYARAASLVLEKVPNVRGYDTKLSSAQRNNLSLVSSICLTIYIPKRSHHLIERSRNS